MLSKAVIIAAGKGTRLHPLTLGVPKELLLVGRQPVIFYALDQTKQARIPHVQVITGLKKGVIQDMIGSGARYGMHVSYAFQETPRGVGHALWHAKHFVGTDDFAVLFGDNIITPENTLANMGVFHTKKGATATLLVKEVSDPSRFGVVRVDETGRILDVFEKPNKTERIPFMQENTLFFAIVGMYIFSPRIFDAIEKTTPSHNGEIQLTDAIRALIFENEPCFAFRENVWFSDIGTFSSLFETQKLLMSNFDVVYHADWWDKKRDTTL
ncbi:hypothetical protein COT72_00640 [archaeon CG10_big_fil_rev_8_21_14_0_10_43_11]|nr:MAG: hypothetical protein COT72_00640 [archaeon CG10_big_fil_rev_8_21_14_0_10_43_11]